MNENRLIRFTCTSVRHYHTVRCFNGNFDRNIAFDHFSGDLAPDGKDRTLVGNDYAIGSLNSDFYGNVTLI